jgi:hypothetical protein
MEDEAWVHWRDAKTTATRICDALLGGVLRARAK